MIFRRSTPNENAELEALREERNQLLNHLTTLYPSWIVYDRTKRATEAAVLVVEIEAGQVSFRLGKHEHRLFSHLKVKHYQTWEQKTPEQVYSTFALSQAAVRIYPPSLATQCLNNFTGKKRDPIIDHCGDDFDCYSQGASAIVRREPAESARRVRIETGPDRWTP